MYYKSDSYQYGWIWIVIFLQVGSIFRGSTLIEYLCSGAQVHRLLVVGGLSSINCVNCKFEKLILMFT